MTTIRTPNLTFSLIRWDWDAGKRKDTQPLDITHMVYNCQWQKSIKTPASTCALIMVPQYKDIHILDYASPMDVIEVREFNRLVFQGYIRVVSATGQIDNDGSPSRLARITANGFGNLLLEGQLGLNLFLQSNTTLDISSNILSFAGVIADTITGGGSYADVIKVLVEEWFTFLEALGATTYRTYIDTWLDLSTAVSGKVVMGIPKDGHFFNSSEQSMTLWSVLQKVAEAPFNEMWFDVGGNRTVQIERNKSISPVGYGGVDLPDEKTYLVFRQTPFKGTVIDGVEKDIWSGLPIKTIKKDYLTRWDLNKSMEESYTYFLASPAIFAPNELELMVMGYPKCDLDAFNKYLYRPMTHNLYFGTMLEEDKPEINSEAAQNTYPMTQYKSQTLLNWFTNNDEFLSGAITMNVPPAVTDDPCIGDRVAIEDIEGTFYAEGITHSWQYGGSIVSNVTVTRGYNMAQPITLKDRIFKRGKFVMDEQWR